MNHFPHSRPGTLRLLDFLDNQPPRLLKAHYEVNEEISARIRARRQSAKDFSVNA